MLNTSWRSKIITFNIYIYLKKNSQKPCKLRNKKNIKRLKCSTRSKTRHWMLGNCQEEETKTYWPSPTFLFCILIIKIEDGFKKKQMSKFNVLLNLWNYFVYLNSTKFWLRQLMIFLRAANMEAQISFPSSLKRTKLRSTVWTWKYIRSLRILFIQKCIAWFFTPHSFSWFHFSVSVW